ncbi:MAG: endonuclease MutS2 [Candidatus Tectimicrobiota bacterium]|nr:MAG: endonuclease MutS2 [Candidatus Tectomicrobia bacterium]
MPPRRLVRFRISPPTWRRRRLRGFYLEGWQFLEVAACLEVSQRLRRYARTAAPHAPLLVRRLERLPDLGLLLREIRHTVDEKGHVRDHASPALAAVRQQLGRLRARIERVLHDTLTAYAPLVQEPVIRLRNDRFVLPFKAAHRQALAGIVHGESASGATVYLEPAAVVTLNNELQHLRAEETRLVREVLRQLTQRLAASRTALEQALQIVGEVDLLVAKGRLSQEMRAVAPRFSSQLQLRLRGARHPLLANPVPIDVQLGPEARTLVITGPNTGGKTAALKTVGLLALMAQCGLHIPAEAGSTLPVFTGIFVDIGDEQSLQQNLSTFSAHVANICTILATAPPGALVLLDELGGRNRPPGRRPARHRSLGVPAPARGDDLGHHPTTGASRRLPCPPRALPVRRSTLTPTPLQPRYRLVYGLPGRSLAFEVAARLGLPEAILARARQEAGLTRQRSEQLLDWLEGERRALAAEWQRLEEARREVARLQEEAARTLDQAKAEEQRVRQALYDEGKALLQAVRRELDATLAALRRQNSASGPLPFPQQAWQRAVERVEALRPAAAGAAPAPAWQVGERVRVRGLNVVGRIRTPVSAQGQVQVEVGNKTLTVAAAALERATAAEPTSAPAVAWASKDDERFPTVLRLLGYTVAEALPVVERYLDQACVQGVGRVRLIHGVGSGRLREAIGELLRQHPLVERFQAGDPGGGTTIVELKG